MSMEKEAQPPTYAGQTGYQLNTYTVAQVPSQDTQHLVPAQEVTHHDLPQETVREKDDDEISNKGEGEPGYIPDKALNLDFEACFHEHKSTKTFKQLYHVLGIVYKYTKLVVYHIFVILIGIPMAILWAILNGIFVFIHVWLYLPAMKITIFWVYAFAPLMTIPLQAVFTPLVDVSARIFRQIRIKATLNGSIGDKLAGHPHNV